MEHAGKKNSKAKKPLLWIVLIIMAVIQIFPLVWLVDFSLASSNEMFTNGLAVLLVILVSIMASFACRRMNWKLSGLVKTLLLMGMMIPIPLCGIFASTGIIPDDQFHGIYSCRTGRGSSYGWMRNLQNYFPDYYTNAEVIHCNSIDHDISEQLE